MFKISKQEADHYGRQLSIETGLIARQADGAVMVRYGGSEILCNAVYAKSVKPGMDFFPLTVHYQEKAFAAGKIPGGFFKREGRPSEKEVLTSRLIDRPIRPLFPKTFFNETQIICTVLAHDMVNNPDVPAIIGASAALAISGAPFIAPIGAARIGYIDNKLVVNPTSEQMKTSRLDLIVAGTKEGVLMVESEVDELSEETMLEAVMLGHKASCEVIDLIEKLAKEAGKDKFEPEAEKPIIGEWRKTIIDGMADKFRKAYNVTDKSERSNMLNELRAEAVSLIADMPEDATKDVSMIIKQVEKDIVRGDILKGNPRIDKRKSDEVRQIDSRTGILERAHGSALFTRGETQALVVATLGSGQDQQIVDALDGEYKEAFMLHYNFPPYSVGEASPMRPPGRREIGHGKLAWRAIRPLLPNKDDFGYTMRVVSEITESNGSSSMATVCGTSLALMDAGVPLKRPCAGIAMGLIKDGDNYAVLSDILGDEDHLGDMDFKVAGTENGITALQMDIKITSITRDIMEIALAQANKGRMHILGEMAKTLTSGRDSISKFAPTLTNIKIDKEKIRDVIGTGGKVIREICETTGAKIDIDDTGLITVSAPDGDSSKQALEWIKSIVTEPEVGTIYKGVVNKIVDFGAFVTFQYNSEGLVHISEIINDRVNVVTDYLQEGQEVYIKCIGIDDRGKVRLSMRVVDQDSGADIEDQVPKRSGPPSRDRGDRDDRRGGGDRGDRGGDRRGGGDRRDGGGDRRGGGDRDDRGGRRGGFSRR